MNFEEIEQQYYEQLQAKLDIYTYRIDDYMVQNYIFLKKHKEIRILEESINNGYKFNDSWKDHLIKEIKKYYSEDQNIEHTSQSSQYKGFDPSFIFKVKDTQKIKDGKERFKILDIRN